MSSSIQTADIFFSCGRLQPGSVAEKKDVERENAELGVGVLISSDPLAPGLEAGRETRRRVS